MTTTTITTTTIPHPPARRDTGWRAHQEALEKWKRLLRRVRLLGDGWRNKLSLCCRDEQETVAVSCVKNPSKLEKGTVKLSDLDGCFSLQI